MYLERKMLSLRQHRLEPFHRVGLVAVNGNSILTFGCLVGRTATNIVNLTGIGIDFCPHAFVQIRAPTKVRPDAACKANVKIRISRKTLGVDIYIVSRPRKLREVFAVCSCYCHGETYLLLNIHRGAIRCQRFSVVALRDIPSRDVPTWIKIRKLGKHFNCPICVNK